MDCDVSLFDTAVVDAGLPGHVAPDRRLRAPADRPLGPPELVPFQNFPTADGWIVVACAKEKFWRRLAEVLGRPELATDTRFATYDDRRRNQAELQLVLDELLSVKSAADWVELLADAGVPCAPVNDVAQALAEPQTIARGMIVETEHPHWGRSGRSARRSTPVDGGRRTGVRRCSTKTACGHPA